MQVAVENGRAAGESSSEGAGEATKKHILTCNTNIQDVVNADRKCILDWETLCCTEGLTCQVEVL